MKLVRVSRGGTALTLDAVLEAFDLRKRDVDDAYGLLPVDRHKCVYVFRATPASARRLKSFDDWIVSVHADPKVVDAGRVHKQRSRWK